MNDYYALYTWAMDRQAQLEREAAQRRLVRHFRLANRHLNTRLRWPLARQHDERKAEIGRAHV